LSTQRTTPQVKHSGVYDESMCARATQTHYQFLERK
jgi:hypothetical protein